MFQWTCFGTAVFFGIAVLVMVYDLKRDVTASLETAHAAVADANRAVTTVNDQLPEIVAGVKKGTETLSALAEDVELIKSVAGIRSDQAGRGLRGLATYADEIQQLLAEQTADQDVDVLIEEVFGSDLKVHATAEEFLVGLNKEMVTLILPLAKSKQEVLYRVCHSAPPRRKPFYLRFRDQQPILLEAFIEQHHAESAALPEFNMDANRADGS